MPPRQVPIVNRVAKVLAARRSDSRDVFSAVAQNDGARSSSHAALELVTHPVSDANDLADTKAMPESSSSYRDELHP
jgi:hypothetical protein